MSYILKEIFKLVNAESYEQLTQELLQYDNKLELFRYEYLWFDEAIENPNI